MSRPVTIRLGFLPPQVRQIFLKGYLPGTQIQYESKKRFKNVQFRFQKRKLSFNVFAVFSSRSVSFPSINRSVSFPSINRSVSFRFVSFRSPATTLAVEWCAVSVLSKSKQVGVDFRARNKIPRSAARYLLVQPSPRSSQLCQTRSP